jgi:hypothetical protein
MLYKIRVGDVLIAEDKIDNKMQMYLVTYDDANGYSLFCLSCGERMGAYKNDKETLKKDIKEFWNIINVIPKEVIADFIQSKFHPSLHTFCHDIDKEYELEIEIAL